MLINYNYRYGLIYTDTQPDFEWRAFSAGMQIGTYIPLSFIHKKMPGIYAEFYRGSQIYEDIYNPSIKEASCGSSSLKVGLYFRIK